MRRVLLAGSLILSAVFATTSPAAPSIVGKEAPDFVLKGSDGRNLRLSEFRGQVVLVNFWARWAGDTRLLMPALDRINTTYQRAGLVVLGIGAFIQSSRASPAGSRSDPGRCPPPHRQAPRVGRDEPRDQPDQETAG